MMIQVVTRSWATDISAVTMFTAAKFYTVILIAAGITGALAYF